MIKVEAKNAKREFFKVRSRFRKLQVDILSEALMESAEPVVRAAQAAAPRRTGRLQRAIRALMTSRRSAPVQSVGIGPHRDSRGRGGIPFYGLFQERGWRATGRKRRDGSAGTGRQIPGKHFLRDAGVQNFTAAHSIFARRVLQRFAEIQAAGQAAGLV